MSGYRTMKRIWIIGDSFSTNMSSKSWTNLLSDDAEIINLSKNGISEYRIYRTFLENKHILSKEDTIIFCHTNPYRIFIPDHINYPTRNKSTHSECDLVLGDVKRHGIFWRAVSYVFIKYFYDEEFYKSYFDLMFLEMDKIKEKGCKVIHITGFESQNSIISMNDIFLNHRGNINHLTEEGNKLVAERIKNFFNGAGDRDRTDDNLLGKQGLYH